MLSESQTEAGRSGPADTVSRAQSLEMEPADTARARDSISARNVPEPDPPLPHSSAQPVVMGGHLPSSSPALCEARSLSEGACRGRPCLVDTAT